MIKLIPYISFLSVFAALTVFIFRQAVSYFKSVKVLFATTFMSYWVIIFLDLINDYLVKTESIVGFTTRIAISSALITAIAAEHLALTLCQKQRQKVSWETLLSNKLYFASASYKGYVTLILLSTWILSPWQIQQVRNVWGDLVYNAVYESWYLASLTVVVVAFMGYPCALFLRSSRKFKRKEVASVLNWFGVGWIGIALTSIIFQGLLQTFNFDMTEIGDLFSVIFFGIIAYAFKRTTILESLFERLHATTYAPRPTGSIKDREVFSKALGITHKHLVGKNIFLEFDPASDYERVTEDFIEEALANAESVAVFTNKGSAVYSALSHRRDVKFLMLTQRVSTPQANTSENKTLLPANNASLLLDALNKELKASPERNSNIVFDNLSTSILMVGFEKTYGFLRYALELFALDNGTSLFLFDPKAHDDKVASAFRSLFSDQVTYGKEGLQVVKTPEPVLKA